VAIDLSLDWRVLAFTAAVTIATTIVFGVAPAFSAARVAPSDALKEHGRGTTSARRGGVSSALVIVQVALSLVLVVAAALFVRTFAGLTAVPLGFAPDGVLVTNVNLSRSRVAAEDRPRLVAELTSAASLVPGVIGAAASVVTPVSGSTWNYNVRVPGAPDLPENEQSSLINVITPGWFATYGTRIVAGRDLDARDNESAPPVAVVNEAFVRRFLPGREPLGAIVEFPSLTSQAQPSRQIVGVVEDAVYRNLREPLRPTLYQPLAQVGAIPRIPLAAASISVRVAAGSPLAASRSIADALARVDRDVTFAFRPLSDQVRASLTQERLVASLAGFFGALALLLAGLGLYGLTAYSANRRRTEIGIRLALGAEPAGVVRLMWLRAAALVGMGIALGTALSVWSLKFIAPLLFQLDPRDTATLAGAALTLAIVGGIAGWLPAYRASRLDAAAVLREG
jgi:predicted permease